MKKKGMTTFFLISVMILSAIPLKGSIDAEGKNGSFGGGSGTESDPYIIEDVWDLQNMSKNLTVHYALGNDIDASVTRTWNSGQGFDPVGTNENSFKGSFNGEKFNITGLFINRSNSDYVGLFGSITSEGFGGLAGSVRNVKLISSNITGRDYVGGLIGKNSGMVSFCHTMGNVIGFGGNVGGLIGESMGMITSCSATGIVSGSGDRVGGLIGGYLAGIAYECYAKCHVIGSGNQTGGFIGYSEALSVDKSFSSGSTIGNDKVGGFVGEIKGRMNNCYANVNTTGYSCVGGLVGETLTVSIVENSYSTGYVTGYSVVGGLVGLNSGSVRGCFYDIETSNHLTSGGGTGKKTSEMKTMKTYLQVSWNFIKTWAIVENKTYPFLRWQDKETPKANAGMGMVVDEGTVVELDGSASSDDIGIVSYVWTFIDGESMTIQGMNTSYQFNNPGAFEVTLNVTDAVGNWDADMIQVVVKDNTSPIANSGPDVVIDEGSIFIFNGSASTDNVAIVNWTWTFFDGEMLVLHGINPSYHFNTPGIFIIILNVSDAEGLWDIDSMNITVLDITLPFADAGLNQTVDEGSLVTFNGSRSSDNVAVVNWTWTFIDMIPITLYGVSPSYRFDNAGTFEVMLRVEDDAGNLNNDTVQVVVIDTELPLADAGPDQYCNMGDTIVLNGNRSSDNVGVVFWKWSFHDGINNALIDGVWFEWKFLVPGLYLITLNVSDAAGNWDVDTLLVTVNDTEDPVAVAGQDQIVDMGIRVFFNASGSSDNVKIIRYEWSFNDGTNDVILEGIIQNWTFTIPKIYTISLTVYDEAGNFHIDSMNVTVNDSRAPVADAGPDLSIKVGEVLRFDGSGSSDNVGITNYSWSFTHDGKDVVLYGIDPVFIFTISGDYIVTLEVRDGNGNVGEDTIEITVLDDGSRTEIKDLIDYWWIALILILFIVGYYVYMRFGNKGAASEE